MSNWGQGAVNNEMGWGQGDVNNSIDWGKSQFSSHSGDTNITGISALVFAYRDRVIADGGTVVSSLICIQTQVNKF